jgi:hypothetical protein
LSWLNKSSHARGLLASAQYFINPDGFSAAGIAFSENGKALLQKYFSCEGPAGTELHFRVQYQYPDGRYANGDVNMRSYGKRAR